jgi:DNA-binding transcriptional MerR regulator
VTAVPQSLTIGEVAQRTGLSVHTLRFYENSGLLADDVERAANGRRCYAEHHVEWFAICTNLRASGMPLDAIRRYAVLVRQGPGNEAERLALLRQHEERVKAQMTKLQQSLDLIAYKVSMYQDGLVDGTAHQLFTPPKPDMSIESSDFVDRGARVDAGTGQGLTS